MYVKVALVWRQIISHNNSFFSYTENTYKQSERDMLCPGKKTRLQALIYS